MDSKPPAAVRPGQRFTTTRWSVVLAARDRRSPGARRALSELCRAYWYPLYAYARRHGLGPDAAQDATQGFFTRLLEKEGLRHVDPSKGRFRSFLLTAFRNHLTDERRQRHAGKRGGDAPAVPIDADGAEGRYACEPSHDATPERLFERRWAMTVLKHALDRLRSDYAGRGREALFEALKEHLVGERGTRPQAETARELGMNLVAFRVAVHRLRRRYRGALLDEVSQTVGAEPEVGSELDHLFAALEHTGQRP